ncbi:Imm74 family immunity protein [Beijerinckia indica]|uniref:Uncharacterized protein n=1 Tax=Beijerinckia indica subsp. indica (strain ATCC 9039 / DSM 1715 / NCIMB 8712) TaxID=395963 RepID=B2IGY5_BEII9|nr:Imm74 family immunity protein [Beijerinckia indica]ACB94399.1 hypothetical protein Bind_0749 [Beijerinckia indica subsp. indica ATCC 9039]
MAKRRGPELKVELTEGAVRIIKGEKILTLVRADCPPGEEDPADFIIFLDDITCWDAPHDSVEIEIDEVQTIVQAIEGAFDEHGLRVAFE